MRSSSHPPAPAATLSSPPLPPHRAVRRRKFPSIWTPATARGDGADLDDMQIGDLRLQVVDEVLLLAYKRVRLRWGASPAASPGTWHPAAAPRPRRIKPYMRPPSRENDSKVPSRRAFAAASIATKPSEQRAHRPDPVEPQAAAPALGATSTHVARGTTHAAQARQAGRRRR